MSWYLIIEGYPRMATFSPLFCSVMYAFNVMGVVNPGICTGISMVPMCLIGVLFAASKVALFGIRFERQSGYILLSNWVVITSQFAPVSQYT